MTGKPLMVDPAEVVEFVERVQRAFLRLDLVAMLDWFTLPLPVYSSAGLRIIEDEDDLISMLRAYRNSRGDTAKSAAGIFSIEPLINARFRVTIRWRHEDSQARPLPSSLVRYFFHAPEDGPWTIEMLEYLEMPIPLIDAENIIQ